MSVKISAQKVQNLRKKFMWSQEDLAEASGLSLRTIQRIEKSSLVSIDSLKAIAAAFDVSADELVQSSSFDGLKWGTVFGFSGATIGSLFGFFGIFNNLSQGGMTGHEAGIWAATIGTISGLSFAFVGIAHYFIERDIEKRASTSKS